MPLYEYECLQCKRRTEKIQKFSDVEITECPHCGGTLERVLSAPAISFKGGGWFADGYGSAKPSASSESKGDSGSGKGDSDASKGDSGSGKGDSSSTAPSADKSATDKPGASSKESAAAPASSTPAPAASSADKK